MLVNDYMTPEPLLVGTDEPLERIVELIREHGIQQVPVVDTANRLVGIVTDRDLRRELRRKNKRRNWLRRTS
jgi:CBS domain-containing protein